MGNKKSILSGITESRLFSAGILFLMIFILNAVMDKNFFTPNKIYGNLSVITPIIVATIAQSIVIISGSIDLSIGSAISLMNCLLAATMGDTGVSVVFGFVVSFFVMMIISALNGFLVAYLRLPAMVATFAVSTILSGVTLLVLPVPGGYIPKWLPRFYSFMIGGIVPMTVFILLALALIWLFISKTRLGRYIYAVGGNENAATASGINPKLMKFFAFLLSGAFIWITGIIISAQTGSGDFRMGNPYTLTTIAAAIMGGVALSGGVGKLFGAALGGSIMILVTNIIYYAGIQSYLQDMIRGLIVIVALFIAAIPSLRKRVV
ncbi:MAG: ABC transporter permease [Treponema sp.]|nr:ABC transporter permease [Treponema sp.]